MQIKQLTGALSVSGQIAASDMNAIKDAGFRAIICNRPDGEANGQPTFDDIAKAAKDAGLAAAYVPVVPGKIEAGDVAQFDTAMVDLPGPVLAFCRTGNRSETLWSKSQSQKAAQTAPISGTTSSIGDAQYEIVIVGAGAGGIAAAASLKSRKPGLEIAIIDPADIHYYQPGWTMVGGGIFEAKDTSRTMGSLIPKDVHWIQASVTAFEPDKNTIVLEGNHEVKYKRLIVCPGIKLDWDKIDGLTETLGRNGVTSNYRYDLAPCTWELVRNMTQGRAIFTQPPMPIKCAGAPQKALYLSGDAWHRRGVLDNIDIQFNNAGGVLFGVKDYVPALMEYVNKYDADLNFFHNLVAVDGPAKKAWFDVSKPDTAVERVEMEFDMMHVCPPQTAPDFIRTSPLADAAGWVDVDQATLRHKTYDNVWSLGDVMNAPNAKTAAAARIQAPIVAENIVADMRGSSPKAQYNGYGSCPLTVERGKIVLAEFGYGGALLPSFPKMVIDGTKPSRAAWFLKEKMLPPIYWKGMLKGREWMAKPEKITTD